MGGPGIRHAVNDHSRLTYTELLTDSWQRANAFFAAAGITVRRVLPDNGSEYRSHAFVVTLGESISHKRARP